MTTPQREAGFYWVKYGGEGEWEVEKWTGEFWKSRPLTYGEQDLIWYVIGPRVPTPEELASVEHVETELISCAIAATEAATARRCAEIADAVTATWNPIYAAEGSIGTAIRREFNLDQGAEIEKYKQVLRSHKWVGRQQGGNPAESESYEWIRYCDVCGMEDTCEDPLPPCPGSTADQGAGKSEAVSVEPTNGKTPNRDEPVCEECAEAVNFYRARAGRRQGENRTMPSAASAARRYARRRGEV